jgi:hypothetical protein
MTEVVLYIYKLTSRHDLSLGLLFMYSCTAYIPETADDYTSVPFGRHRFLDETLMPPIINKIIHDLLYIICATGNFPLIISLKFISHWAAIKIQ